MIEDYDLVTRESFDDATLREINKINNNITNICYSNSSFIPNYELEDLSDEIVDKVFEFWKQCDIKGFVLPVYMFNDSYVNRIGTFIEKTIQEGFNLDTLKFHCRKPEIEDLATSSVSQEKYKDKLLEIVDFVKGKIPLKRVTILNERNDIILDNDNTSWILGMIEELHNRDIEVSITFDSIESLNRTLMNRPSIIKKLDFLCSNYYPFVSVNLGKTSQEEYKQAFDSVINFSDYIKINCQNKKFIISECGVIPYEEALTATWKYSSKDKNQFPNGATYNSNIPLNYIKGFFENTGSNKIDEVWGWFINPYIYRSTADYSNYASYLSNIRR